MNNEKKGEVVDSEKNSKEMQDILDAIVRYTDKYEGDVCIHMSVCGFDKDSNVVDDREVLIGNKRTLIVSITELKKQLKTFEDDYIVW